MIRFRFLVCVVAVVAIAMFPAAAQADYQLRVSADGGSNFTTYYSNDFGASWNTKADFSGTSAASVVVDNLTIKANSSSFLDPTVSTLQLTVSGSQATKTYNVLVQASITGVPTQPPPQTLSWDIHSSSTLNRTSGGVTIVSLTEKMEGWVNSSNVIFDHTAGTTVADTGLQAAPSVSTQSFSDNADYSWTEQYTLTGQGHTGFQISAGNNEEIDPSAAPAPSGLLLLLTAMPALGLWTLLRRRRVQIAA